MAAQSGQGAIDLLGQHGAGEFMGEGHGGEREQQVGAGAPFGRKAVVAAEEEDEVAAVGFAFFDQLDEAGAVVGFAGGVEENLVRGGVAGEEIIAAGVDFTHGDARPALGAFEKLGGDGV